MRLAESQKLDNTPYSWLWRLQGSSKGQLRGGEFNTIKPNHIHTLTAHTLGTHSTHSQHTHNTHSTHSQHTAHTHSTHTIHTAHTHSTG